MDRTTLTAWLAGLGGAFLIVGGLAWFVIQRTAPPGVDVARAELRRKNLSELQALNARALTTYELLDKNKGLYRIPIRQAMAMTVDLWRDPAAGRADLLARIDKATAKPPEKPNEYE
ncbi:MAG: hypothetical protein IPM17_10420 [Verrucomicrobia bacterium]|jgi:hypothetical protein|nr:hypothetical protein [Verrucomicrobiota bacterium]